jgi:Tetratricopeptide repeat
VVPHVRRYRHARLKALIDWSRIEPRDLFRLTGPHRQNDVNVEAEEMYMRALRGKEKAWGAEHTLTLDTVNHLGNLYTEHGKMVEAEKVYMRALQGVKKAWEPEHTSTLRTINNFGNLRCEQGELLEAEEMYSTNEH